MIEWYTVDFRGRLIFDVQKINKRLVIVLQTSSKMIPLGGFGKYLNPKGYTIFYTPPDHIRHKVNRENMRILADTLNKSLPADRILAIMVFESSVARQGKRNIDPSLAI